MPPPEASRPLPAAVLPFTSELFRLMVPWLTIPAPLVWLAVLSSTSVLLSTASLPLAMPPAAMGGPSPPGGGGRVAVDLAVVDGDRAQQVLDASTAGVGGGVVVHLAVVEGQDAAATSEVHVVAARDPASDEPLSGVAVRLAAVQRHRAQNVQDPAAAQAAVPPIEGLLVVTDRAVVQRQLCHARRVEGGARDPAATHHGG